MTGGRLYISFWHIALENFPEGRFKRRKLSRDEAREIIHEAQQAGGLVGVCEDDLLAPYRQRESQKHTELCEVLEEHFGIRLCLEDFCSKGDEDGEPLYFVRPLNLVEVSNRDRLMVVTCMYSLSGKNEKAGDMALRCSIAPDSVAFHLFEGA